MVCDYVAEMYVSLAWSDEVRWCRWEFGTLEDPGRQSAALSVPCSCSTVLSSSATTVRHAHWWTLGGIWSPFLSPKRILAMTFHRRVFLFYPLTKFFHLLVQNLLPFITDRWSIFIKFLSLQFSLFKWKFQLSNSMNCRYFWNEIKTKVALETSYSLRN